jgi:organic hydroperoxide reductase OsmC/OhrA
VHPYPHHYRVIADVNSASDVTLKSVGLPSMRSAAPMEFDGPGDLWSPEHLIVAAIADCYAVTFQGLARRSNLAFESLTCAVDGTLERVENVTRFTRFIVRPRLQLADGAHLDLARRILVRAEETCLITRSLNAVIDLDLQIEAPDEALVLART